MSDSDGNAAVRCPDGTSVVVPAGSPALVRLVAEPAADNCAAGGQRVEAGRDLDGDGVLASGEVESAAYICPGPTGGTAIRVQPARAKAALWRRRRAAAGIEVD